MPHDRNLHLNTLLIVVGVLAVAGGLTTVLVTSPLSFDLARLAFLQSIITPESTAALSSTPTHTSVPAAPTVEPTASSGLSITVPLATSIPTAQQTSTPRPTATATATATGVILPPDARALAIVSGPVGATVVRVRDLPNGSQVIAALPGGTVVQVLFGRSVVDGIEWLQVRLANGRVGWIAGYLLTITLERPAGTDTTETPGTEAATSTPVPATVPPNSTGQAPPRTAAPTATHLSSGPTVTPSRTAFVPPTGTQTSPPAIVTDTPTLPATEAPTATDTPVTPPATATDEATATLPPPPTETPTNAPPPTDTPTDAPNPTDTPTP